MKKPSVVLRAQEALKVFRHGYPAEVKGMPFAWPSFRQLKPQWHLINLQSYINEGWCLNALVYSAIMYKVRATVSAPLRAYTGDPDYPTLLSPNHRLSKLVARPNEHQSWVEFQALNYVYFNLDGNVFILKDPLEGNLYSLRPDRVFIVPNDSVPAGIAYYVYVPEGSSFMSGIPILFEDMIHIKLPWPGDELEGMGYGFSPLSPAAQAVDVDNLVTRFLNLFFQRGSMLTGLLMFDVPLKESMVDKIRASWAKRYGGIDNWGVGVLDRGGKYERLGLTFEEMGFGDLDARSETRIVMPFGVPPILIGSKVGLDRSTYSNYGEARKACWEDTLVPELLWFEAEYAHHFKGRNAFVKFDTSGVPALQKDVPKQAAAAYTMWQMGVPADQALVAAGLKVGPVPKGHLPFAGAEPKKPGAGGDGEDETERPGGDDAPVSNDQGPRADEEDDSWGMRCMDCDGEMKLVEGTGSNGSPPKFECDRCHQEFYWELA